MKTNNHHRRLDKVQEYLHIPDAAHSNPDFVLQLCNVPDLATACARAKRAHATTVFFVALLGDVQRADGGEVDELSAGVSLSFRSGAEAAAEATGPKYLDAQSVGVVLAFEGARPTPDQIAAVKGHGGELAFARAGLCEGEVLGISCAGGPLFWVQVKP
jgi:hypothetical protein